MKLSVRVKLYAGFGLLILILCLSVVTGIYRMKVMEDKQQAIVDIWMPGVEQVKNIQYLTEHLRKLDFKYLVEDDPQASQAIMADINQTSKQLEQELADYEKTLATDEIRSNFSAFQKPLQDFTQARQTFLKLADNFDFRTGAGPYADSVAATIHEVDNAVQKMQDSLQKLIISEEAGAHNAVAESHAFYVQASRTSMITAIVFVLIGSLYAFFLVRSIRASVTRC